MKTEGNRNHGKTHQAQSMADYFRELGYVVVMGVPMRPLPASALEGVHGGTKAEGELMERVVMRRLRRIR